MTATAIYAHLYRRPKAAGGGYAVILTDSPANVTDGETIPVKGLRDANKLAAERGAIAWNF